MKYIVNTLLLILVSITLTACGSQTYSSLVLNPLEGSTTLISPTPVPTPSPTPIQAMANRENAYRTSVGQALISPGLVCNLYTLPSTNLLMVGATRTVLQGAFGYGGVFNQPVSPASSGLNVLPKALQAVYQSWFILKCFGSLLVPVSDYHVFDLTSDDGSNLYIDSITINNDGLHSLQTKTATKYLKYGIHTFEIDFFQATGDQALILKEDGAIMSNEGFYH